MAIGRFELISGGAVLMAGAMLALALWYSSRLEEETKAAAAAARVELQRKLEAEAAERRAFEDKPKRF